MFVNPVDYKQFYKENGSREPVYVEVKNFVLRLESLDAIGVGEFGASALQKDAMRISKIDTIKMVTRRIKEENPLSGIQCEINLIFCSPDAPMDGGLVSLETD